MVNFEPSSADQSDAERVARRSQASVDGTQLSSTSKDSFASVLRRALVAPVWTALAADERRRLELLAALSLATLAVLPVITVVLVLAESAAVAHGMAPIVVATFLGASAAHLLARAGAERAAAWTIVATQIGTPLAVPAFLPMDDVIRMQIGGWVAVGVLTSNVTLDSRSGLLTGLGTSVGVVVVWLGAGTTARNALEPAVFVGTVSAMVYVYSRQRTALEADRQRQLRERNDELEHLRVSLEHRVKERTSDLERANESILDKAEMLLRSEKMAAVGRLTAGFAHELATPLSSTASSLATIEALRAEYASSIGDASVTSEDHRAISTELAQAVALARTANGTALRFVKGIRAHTRDPGPKAIELFDVDAVVAQTVELVDHLARAARVALTVERSPDPATLRGVPSRLNQAITNLVQNAIDAVAGLASGTVCVRVRHDGPQTLVEVEDNGAGIAPEVAARMFEPLFTTKPYGRGTGLGLAIVDEIVRKEFGGEVVVRTILGVGTTFVVKIRTDRGGPDGA